MQTYVQYRVCEGPLPSIGTLRRFSSDTGPTCFLMTAASRQHTAQVNADDLVSFLETFGDTPEKLQVLFFLGRHPKARCTAECISCTPGARRMDLRRAILELARQGVVEQAQDDDLTLYTLTSEHEKKEAVEALGKLTWDQIRFWNDFRVVELTQLQSLC